MKFLAFFFLAVAMLSAAAEKPDVVDCDGFNPLNGSMVLDHLKITLP